MRQFQTTLQKEISRGLRPDYRVVRNGAGLVDLFNAETSDEGLSTFSAVDNPFDISLLDAYGLALDWPFPQLFRGRSCTLLVGKNSLFFVNESDWSLTPITTYNAYALDTELTMAIGEPWQFLDMGKAWMLMNNTGTVFVPGYQEMFGHSQKVLTQATIGIRTGCYFKGRAILGGFNPTSFWHDHWSAFWKDWGGRRELGIVPPLEITENMVWWSTIGGGDVFSFIYPDLNIQGMLEDEDVNSVEKPIIFDLLLRNECGLMPIAFGAVRCVKPLGNAVIVYSDNGVSALIPAIEPVPTMGLVNLSDIGIYSGLSISGDDRQHVWLDNGGSLWAMGQDLKPTLLGYREVLLPFIGDEVIASYSPEDKGKWFFSNGFRTFLYKNTGMSEVDQIVTSCGYAAGGTVGFCSEAGSVDPAFVLVTQDIDFGIRGIKHIHSVELSCAATSNLYVSIYYRYNKAEEVWKQTAWRRVNKEGWAVMACSGVDFRIGIRGEDFREVEPPDYMTIKWGVPDKRNIRGQYDS